MISAHDQVMSIASVPHMYPDEEIEDFILDIILRTFVIEPGIEMAMIDWDSEVTDGYKVTQTAVTKNLATLYEVYTMSDTLMIFSVLNHQGDETFYKVMLVDLLNHKHKFYFEDERHFITTLGSTFASITLEWA